MRRSACGLTPEAEEHIDWQRDTATGLDLMLQKAAARQHLVDQLTHWSCVLSSFKFMCTELMISDLRVI